MFAYCGNNSVNRIDITGGFWEDLCDEIYEIIRTLEQSGGYCATAAGIALLDSPAIGPADLAALAAVLGGSFVYILESIEISFPTAFTVSAFDILSEATLHLSKGKQRILDTGLAHETDEEVIRKARDKTLPSKERERYISEAKGRGYRNISKRASVYRIRIKR